eukprot:768515-Hanusia_phi.AAC.1
MYEGRGCGRCRQRVKNETAGRQQEGGQGKTERSIHLRAGSRAIRWADSRDRYKASKKDRKHGRQAGRDMADWVTGCRATWKW